jgi:hypothetical protein
MNSKRCSQSVLQAVILSLIMATVECAWGQTGLLSYRTPAYLQFASENFSEFDEEKNAVISVIRTGEYREPVSVSYTTRDVTARAGIDYAPTSGTLLIPAGVAVAEFLVPILVNDFPKEPRTVELVLFDADPNSLILQRTAILSILDPMQLGNEDLPRLEIRMASEGRVVISWPQISREIVIEKSRSVVAGQWVELDAQPEVDQGLSSVVEPATADQHFYRLRLR